MRFDSLTLYRPTRTPDGSGGVDEVMDAGRPLYGALQIHEGALEIAYRVTGSVLPGDVIETGDGAQYRVATVLGQSGAPVRAAQVERIARPIHPRPI